ncbi:MAG: hypothetical protein H7099_01520 [Gemmatimonadaceae bacterium]|nr:hypothetical protein [Gemmatimonadaceae bacterium]
MHDAPRRRSLDSLKKEAKRWLAELDTSDAARDRLYRITPDAPASPSLRDVQHALARESGEPGWASLKAALIAAGDASDETLAQYDDMARALLDAYTLGTPEAMERHWSLTWHRRAWRAMRTYVQIDLGRVAGPDVDISLDDARWLVAREHDFADWDDLARAVATAARPEELVTRPIAVFGAAASDRGNARGMSRDWRQVVMALADPMAVGLHAHGQMTDVRAQEISTLTHLTTLRLDGSQQLTDEGVRALAALPNLEHLDLQGSSVTDTGLAALRDLTSLKSLSLAWTGVSDAGMQSLTSLQQLERIDLTGTSCGDGAVRAFAGTPRLRDFRSGVATTDAALPVFHDYPVFKRWHGGVEVLSLTGNEAEPNSLALRGALTDHGMRSLSMLHGLFALDIDDAKLQLTGRAIVPLISMEHLGRLAFDAKDDAMRVIARLPCLRFLSCQDTTASDAAWADLGASTSIESIWGRRCHGLGDRGFAALSRMPTLEKLSVSCLNVSDTALAALPFFPALRELMPMDIPDAGYRHIGACRELDSLVLMYCRDTTDLATSHITQLRKLTSYFASYTQVTDATPRMLSGIDSLERVTFDSCAGLTDDGVGALARLPRLRELRISGQRLTADAARAFPDGVTVHFHR